MMEWQTCKRDRRDMLANPRMYSIAESGAARSLEAEDPHASRVVEVGEWVTRACPVSARENEATLGRMARRLMATERARLLHHAGNLGRLARKRKVQLKNQLWREARKPLR